MEALTENGVNNAGALGHRRSWAGLSPEERHWYVQIPNEVKFIGNPLFYSPRVEERLFGPGARIITIPEWTPFIVPDTEDSLDILPHSRGDRLSGRDISELFLRYNYARFRLSRLVKAQKKRFVFCRARQMVIWHRRAMALRSDLVEANMGLVVAMAKRMRIAGIMFAELVTEGNLSLLKAVECFDVGRGFQFSTYACRAILRGFGQLAAKVVRYNARFGAEYNQFMDPDDAVQRRRGDELENGLDILAKALKPEFGILTNLEATIISHRYGIGKNGPAKTLDGVKKIVGLCRERVRQIQRDALKKMAGAFS